MKKASSKDEEANDEQKSFGSGHVSNDLLNWPNYEQIPINKKNEETLLRKRWYTTK